MKRNRTICTLLSAAVLCACLWLAGCGQQGEETQQTNSALDPRIAEYLSLDSKQAGTLSNDIQDVDVTTKGNDFTLHVIQTLGNQRELYILYDVTFADSVKLPASDESWPGSITRDFQSADGQQPTSRSTKNEMIGQEGQTQTYIDYVSWENDTFPKGDMIFSVGNFSNDEDPAVPTLTKETLEASWTPTNQGTLLQRDMTDPDGKNVGTMTLSSYSVSFQLTEALQIPDTEDGWKAQISCLLDDQGKEVYKRGASGGGAYWSTSFGKYVDLSKVATVELGEYVASLGE